MKVTPTSSGRTGIYFKGSPSSFLFFFHRGAAPRQKTLLAETADNFCRQGFCHEGNMLDSFRRHLYCRSGRSVNGGPRDPYFQAACCQNRRVFWFRAVLMLLPGRMSHVADVAGSCSVASCQGASSAKLQTL